MRSMPSAWRRFRIWWENGYQGEPLGEIQEGYGTQTAEGTAPSYLIPVDVTRLIAPDNKEYFWAHSSDSWMMPKERYFACTENRWFYHRDRHCKIHCKQGE